MGLQTAFDLLSEVIEQYESRGRSVRHVETATSDEDTALHATMDVPVPLCAASGGGVDSALTPASARLTDRGELEVTFATAVGPDLGSTSGATVSVTEREARLTDEGVVMTVELTIEPEDGAPAATGGPGDAPEAGATDRDGVVGNSAADAEPTDPYAAVRDESVPPYEDTEYLRRLYEDCETFAEMSREIEMDVSSETVRRYMIEADIHDPSSYDTSAVNERTDEGSGTADSQDPDSESGSAAADAAEPAATGGNEDPMETIPDEQLVTDGIGLPADLTIEDIADAVVGSITLYEVQRHLGLDQNRTRELLKQLNLLDLVLHRIGGAPERSTSYEEVAARIRQCTPEEA